MPLYYQLEGIGSSVGIAEGSAEARCSSSSSSLSFSTYHHHRCHHQMTHYHNCLIRGWWSAGYPQGLLHTLPDRSQQCSLVIGLLVRHQQIEANPSLVPLSPYQKLTGISMARNYINRRVLNLIFPVLDNYLHTAGVTNAEKLFDILAPGDGVRIYPQGVRIYPDEIASPELLRDWHNSGVGIKSLLNAASITTSYIRVNAAQLDMDQDSAHMVAASKVPMLKPDNGATLPKTVVVEGVEKVMPITSAEDKGQRRLEVKARSTLLMGISNENHLKFNSIKDAKLLLEAVEKRFGENAATKKTQRNLLKQQYENFTAPRSEMLDQTFDRLQKFVSQLDLLDEKLSQEDVNQKLLRSLSPEWNTHAVVWRNKAELETMSMDDLYKNLKVYEPKFKGMSSSSSNTQNMAFVSSSKVECYNCHKRGHFARKCRAPRNQDNKNKEISRRSVLVETTTSTALVSCDGLCGYDWSDQA
ncbi:ribonuclease H-like domain-containing protein [Tanacetum coccineum]|uniref:Ribonuclease H-like domain-containing protein n=1 Tax=Tanacetum coccineum TaxID=301880 RepID=A0ABQ5H6Q6_9ASTR